MASVWSVAQETALVRRGVGQQAQRLVGMAGENDAVERVRRTVGSRHCDAAAGCTGDARDGEAGAETVAEGCGEFLDVGFGTAVHRPPLVLGVESEKPVVVKETQQRRGGKLQHQPRGGAPDG